MPFRFIFEIKYVEMIHTFQKKIKCEFSFLFTVLKGHLLSMLLYFLQFTFVPPQYHEMALMPSFVLLSCPLFHKYRPRCNSSIWYIAYNAFCPSHDHQLVHHTEEKELNCGVVYLEPFMVYR